MSHCKNCYFLQFIKGIPNNGTANLKNISDETSKCSYFSSTGSIVANSKIKIIPIDPGNLVGLLETRSGAIRGPEPFFPLRGNARTKSVNLTMSKHRLPVGDRGSGSDDAQDGAKRRMQNKCDTHHPDFGDEVANSSELRS